jgi:hypothetical protein
MSVPLLYTYSDVIEHLIDFTRGVQAGARLETMARSVRSAYHEILAAHNWTFLESVTRVQLAAAQTTGTIAYSSSTGQVTLTGATWPTNVVDMRVRFDDVVSHVETRNSDTVITLDAIMRPTSDVSAGESYSVYPRWYVLPPDFMALSDPLDESVGWRMGTKISVPEMHQRERFADTTGSIRYYAIGSAPGLYGSMALFIDPPSDAAETLDIPYKRRARDIKYTGYLAADYQGSITTTASGTTVTGTSTAFSNDHLGSIIRRGNTNRPTGFGGENPYLEQRSITAVASATSLTIDTGAAASASTVEYMITDPLDLDVAAYDALLRLSEYKLARVLRMDGLPQLKKEADDALFSAKCADGRTRGPMVAGNPVIQQVRLADYKTRTVVS